MSWPPDPCIVDTNVAIVANGRGPESHLDCQRKCIELLQAIHAGVRFVLDDQDLILQEYMKNLSLSGQPGTGDVFMKYVFDSRYYEERCVMVPITPTGVYQFEEFPQRADLETFDLSDRKFVAVAAACPEQAVIVNASDSDWKNHETPLREAGISVVMVCDC